MRPKNTIRSGYLKTKNKFDIFNLKPYLFVLLMWKVKKGQIFKRSAFIKIDLVQNFCFHIKSIHQIYLEITKSF